MQIKESEPLKNKNTMRIGGTARYFAEITTKEDVKEAHVFAQEKNIPLIILGAGSNTIFADGMIDAFVVRIKSDAISIDGNHVTSGAGKNLATLINELAGQGLDLSTLTGIPGTLGGAIVGNAGQGPKGVWIDSFVKEVEIFQEGEWRTLQKEDCDFAYRESIFKKPEMRGCIIWEAKLDVPQGKPEKIKTTIEELLQKRIETQPHAKTSGSCFAALPDGTPAWKLIDEAGLRGLKVGGIQISEKHANFLINENDASFEDALAVIKEIQEKIPSLKEIEMRIIHSDGTLNVKED